MEVLGDLRPSFGGTITPGNASDLSEGAGCVLLADADRTTAEGVEPLAHVTDYVAAYRDPKWFNMATGGAVSLGHPIGASGAILTTTLAYRMERGDLDRGIVGMSVGGGGGIAALLER